ncbi:Breast cancer anti-estrogen resistance protein 1 [Trichinella murrelli]|uniref:Breast cancer anti-estrogen resistance protein 1 n=1 Tax=Trichinella murrelli TaxID=144512 RepID=A0A0V0U819_9BILA|nr:Breast cancer anti-estrogen resistance protein 1 [Trichinella murrelli]
MFSTEVMVVQCLSRFCGRELLLTFDNYFKLFGQNEMINQKTVVLLLLTVTSVSSITLPSLPINFSISFISSDHFAKYDIMVTEVNMNDGKKSTGLQIWKNSTMAQLVLDRLSNTHIYYDGLNRCERSASKVNASEINPLLLSSFFDDIPVSLYDFWNFIKENEYQTVQNVPGVTTYSKNITLQNHTAAVTIDLFDPAYLLPKGGSFNVPLHMNILMYEKAGEEVGKVVGNVSYSFFGFNANLTENDKEKYFLPPEGVFCVGLKTDEFPQLTMKNFATWIEFVDHSQKTSSLIRLIYSDEQKVIAFTNNPDSNLTFNRVVNVTNLNSFVIHDFNSGIQYVVDANSMHCIAVSALPPMSGDARILNQTTAYTLIALKSATDILTMFDQFTYGYVGKRMYDENFFDVWISRGENQTVNSSTVYELWMQTNSELHNDEIRPRIIRTYRTCNGKVHLASYTFFNFAAVDVRQTLWKNAHIQPCLRFEENNSYLSFTVNRTISKLNAFGVKEIEKGLVERLSAIADISPLRFSTFAFQPNGNNTFVFFQLANVADINGTRTETYKEEKNLIVAVDTLNKTLEGDNIVVVVHNFQGDSMALLIHKKSFKTSQTVLFENITQVQIHRGYSGGSMSALGISMLLLGSFLGLIIACSLNISTRNSFAEALYDNNAEWPDELTFRRGDVLKVLERNPAKGLAQGWWLCFDPSTGKTGIAPSNRLKSMDRPPSSSQSRLITPRRIGDVFVYDQSNFKAVADGNGNGAAHPFDYKKAFLLNDFLPMKNNEIVENVEETEDNRGDVDEEDIYDVPTASTVGRKPVIRNVPITLVREPSEAGLSKKSSAEERSTVVYDSPSVVVQRSSLTSGLLGRGVQRPALVEPTFSKTGMAKLFAAGDASAEGCLHSVGSSSQSSQSDRFSYSSDSSSAGFRGTVPVELESQGKDLYDVPTGTRAKADLTKPTVDALPPVDELSSLCLLSSTAPKPAPKQAQSELQQLFDQYKANMATLADSSSLLPFTDAQWSALTKNCRTTLSLLRRLLQLVGEAADPSLQQSVGLMQRLASDMEAPSAMRDADRTYPLMRQFTIVARRVLDQLRMHLNNFNNNNNKQSRWQNGKIVPITTTANGEEGNANDADGILNNGSTASVADGSAYDFVKNVSLTNRSHSNGSLDVDDRRLLRFYSSQIDSHIHCLSSAINDFLAAVENNQPPRSFIGLGKLVILAAHKLVYIGDNIAQCVHSRSVQLIVTEHADRLCDVLRACVASTKLAAQNYPAIPSIQAMISSVVAVSQSAQQLRLFVNIPLLGDTKRALSG